MGEETLLLNCRRQIDKIDREIWRLLARRTKIVEKIGCWKKKSGMLIRDPLREEEIIRQKRLQAVVYGLDPDFVESVYRKIFDYGVAIQQKIHEGKK